MIPCSATVRTGWCLLTAYRTVATGPVLPLAARAESLGYWTDRLFALLPRSARFEDLGPRRTTACWRIKNLPSRLDSRISPSLSFPAPTMICLHNILTIYSQVTVNFHESRVTLMWLNFDWKMFMWPQISCLVKNKLEGRGAISNNISVDPHLRPEHIRCVHCSSLSLIKSYSRKCAGDTSWPEMTSESYHKEGPLVAISYSGVTSTCILMFESI